MVYGAIRFQQPIKQGLPAFNREMKTNKSIKRIRNIQKIYRSEIEKKIQIYNNHITRKSKVNAITYTLILYYAYSS